MCRDIFPITRIVVENHRDHVKELFRNDKLKCWRCANVYDLTEDRVQFGSYDREIIVCPFCKVKTDAYHYFDNTLNKHPGKKKPRVGRNRRASKVIKRLA